MTCTQQILSITSLGGMVTVKICSLHTSPPKRGWGVCESYKVMCW